MNMRDVLEMVWCNINGLVWKETSPVGPLEIDLVNALSKRAEKHEKLLPQDEFVETFAERNGIDLNMQAKDYKCIKQYDKVVLLSR